MRGRYDRLAPLDMDTETVQDTTVAVVGLGATGSHMAENLARIGTDLILLDRDYLEHANLTASALYTEQHITEQLPKAVAAQQALERVNSTISIEAHVQDVNRHTIADLLNNADLIMDGTDNMETRFILNEYAVKTCTPWIHVSALGYAGETLPVHPGGACFSCIFSGVDASKLDTCETAGIRKETAATAASIATGTATSLLQNQDTDGLTRFNLRNHEIRTLSIEQDPDCLICRHRRFPHLSGDAGSATTALCGENKYQVAPDDGQEMDLEETADTLARMGEVKQNRHLLKFSGDDTVFTLFRDGRAIINAETTEEAKSVYARFVGS